MFTGEFKYVLIQISLKIVLQTVYTISKVKKDNPMYSNTTLYLHVTIYT